MNLDCARKVTEPLARAFVDAGHSLYLVGGSVRDAILGIKSDDLDFTTSARPDQIESILKGLGGPMWDMGRDFGTIGTILRSKDEEWKVEITTFRADAYEPGSRKPMVRFGDRIDEDLIRRDFTINAMAVNLADGSFVDPYRGQVDLAEGVLRTPSTPEVSFSDDPLRMMRAARFAARFSFRPVPEIIAAMMNMTERLRIVSAERIRDEFSKLLLCDTPRVGVNILVRTGLSDIFLPELAAMKLEIDEHHHHKDVYEHSLTVLDQAIALEKSRNHSPDIVNRLAALLHDIGKPKTKRLESGGKVSFHHHDVVGAKMARKRLTELKYPKDVVESVAELIFLHLRFHGYGEGQWTDSAVRRYVRDAGPELERLHILTRSDCTTRIRAKADRLRRAYEELEWRIDELAAQEEIDSIRPDLDGNQIMEILGIGPGRDVGAAYSFLLERRLDRGPVTAEEATAELLAWWAERFR
ncbi:MAG: CCA tRNA nucleotidyltransferase [Propionibacteriaceae bacterium]|jgi:poly(A) polymerase|nr:CCA tRNA nucleotidyltransferase [Propionibacteriaceae bacterium]